jgi:AcrR family transcriptional regulator
MMKPIVAVNDDDGAVEKPPSASNRAVSAAKKRPAHRPSRRKHIIDAATKVFAQQGYVEASVEDIAKSAGVAPTAIYYHFGGKEELFNQSLRAAMEDWSDVLIHARPEIGGVDALREVVRTGFQYWKANPDSAVLIARYSEGSTVQALQMRRDWEQRHLDRAYDYIAAPRAARSSRRAREQRAAHSLTMRLMIDVILVMQALAVDGVLGEVEIEDLSSAVQEMSVDLIESLR